LRRAGGGGRGWKREGGGGGGGKWGGGGGWREPEGTLEKKNPSSEKLLAVRQPLPERNSLGLRRIDIHAHPSRGKGSVT